VKQRIAVTFAQGGYSSFLYDSHARITNVSIRSKYSTSNKVIGIPLSRVQPETPPHGLLGYFISTFLFMQLFHAAAGRFFELGGIKVFYLIPTWQTPGQPHTKFLYHKWRIFAFRGDSYVRKFYEFMTQTWQFRI